MIETYYPPVMTSQFEEGWSAPLTIVWEVKNIWLLLLNHDDMQGVTSPILRSHTLGGKFFLNFNPKSAHSDYKCIAVGLTRSGEPLDFAINCECSLVRCRGSNLVIGIMQNQDLSEDTLYLPDCPTFEEVFVTKKSELLHNENLVIKWRIWKSDEFLPSTEDISCETRLQSFNPTFSWPISRFSALKLFEEVTIPITYGDSRLKENFLLKFSLKGISLDDSIVDLELVSISVFQSCIASLHCFIMSKDRMNDKHGESMPEQFLEGGGVKTVRIPNFVSRKDLLNDKTGWLRNDVLNLVCKVYVLFFNSNITISDYNIMDIEKCLHTRRNANCQTMEPIVPVKISASLTKDFLAVHKEKNPTDFRLCSGDTKFAVHKSVLSARSPVFETMFSNNMQESGSDSLDVPDLDSHTLNRMLTFFYCDTLEPDLDVPSAAKLYYAADKYQVQRVKQHCSCVLRSGISVSNVSDILFLADSHHDEELISFVQDFFLRHFDEIMQTVEWERFMDKKPAYAGSAIFLLYKKKLQLEPKIMEL